MQTKSVILEQMFTIVEIADLLKIKKRAVYKLIKQGHIKALRVGRQIRIYSSALEEYLECQTLRGA